jgi:predicted DNA-binding transcriptional regulator YafY
VEEMKARLEQTFHLKTEDNILSFEENPYLTGREYIGDIYSAIVNQRVLRITYKPFKTNKELTFEIHPYHLKQFNNRWFLFGLNNEYQNITNLALDRIQTIIESNIKYIQNTEIDFREYFEDVIGVSVDDDKQPVKVVIKVDEEILPYIVSKPIHGSQKIKWNSEEEALIELELQLNYELESLIFSFGDKMEVIKPVVLRTSITKSIKVLNQKYLTNAQ